MSLIKGLRDKPSRLTVASKYTALNGIGYLVVGAILIVWPGVTQTVPMLGLAPKNEHHPL